MAKWIFIPKGLMDFYNFIIKTTSHFRIQRSSTAKWLFISWIKDFRLCYSIPVGLHYNRACCAKINIHEVNIHEVNIHKVNIHEVNTYKVLIAWDTFLLWKERFIPWNSWSRVYILYFLGTDSDENKGGLDTKEGSVVCKLAIDT